MEHWIWVCHHLRVPPESGIWILLSTSGMAIWPVDLSYLSRWHLLEGSGQSTCEHICWHKGIGDILCRRRQPGLHKCWPFLPAWLRLVDSCKVVYSFSRDAVGFKVTFAPSSLTGLGMTVPSWLAKQSLALLSFCLAIDFNGDSLTIAFDKQVCIALNCTGSASGMKYTELAVWRSTRHNCNRNEQNL